LPGRETGVSPEKPEYVHLVPKLELWNEMNVIVFALTQPLLDFIRVHPRSSADKRIFIA
jgi:hypothetical protein